MNDLLEQSLREALSDRAAQLDDDPATRLRALDYHPRRHRIPVPAIGALGAGAVAFIALVALGSGAAPAFAGWQATPTTTAPGQPTDAAQLCPSSPPGMPAPEGTPVLTDTRGPYTAAIYGDGVVCLAGNGVSVESDQGPATPTLPADQVELAGAGMQDSAGDALTLVDGRVGSSVTAVTIDRADGTSVQATVTGGWYLAWWPGTAAATTAEVATATGTSSQAFPQRPAPQAVCPTGARCSGGYGFGGQGGQVSSIGGSRPAGNTGSASGSTTGP